LFLGAWRAVRAAGQIRSLDTSQFVGPEADEYREGLSENLPPHLHQAGQAFGLVATALTAFAGDLSELQERMSPAGPGTAPVAGLAGRAG